MNDLKYIAHTLSDSLIQSAIYEVAKVYQVENALFYKIRKAFAFHSMHDTQDYLSYKEINDRVVILFRKWGEATTNGEIKNAKHYQEEIDTLVTAHPFPWKEVSKLFIDRVKKPTAWKYIDWKDSAQGIDLSVIDYQFPPHAKMAVIGDWGTGTADALFLLEDIFNTCVPDVILHTGDIYFSASSFEVQQNFIQPLEKIFEKIGRRIPVFTIPGNHDYYAGGDAFYDLLNVINAPLGKSYLQEASYFCLRAEDNSWQILGGDTGINDHASFQNLVSAPPVRPSELEWHEDKLTFPGKTLLLTHHQMIDTESSIASQKGVSNHLQYFNTNLLNQFGKHFSHIDLWLWGHSHKFMAFKKGFPIPSTALIMPLCRLIGSSARRVSSLSIKYPDILQTNESGDIILPDHNNGLFNHSYALIDFGEKTVSYYQTPAWDEDHPSPIKTLPADQKRCFFKEPLP